MPQKAKKVKRMAKSKKTKSNVFKSIFSSKKAILVVFVLVFAGIGGWFIYKSFAASFSGTYEADQYTRINFSRAANGRSTLPTSECLANEARAWAKHMADTNSLNHQPSLSGAANTYCDGSWTVLHENIGVGTSSSEIFAAFQNSPEHWSNILDSQNNRMGAGVYIANDGRMWIVQEFANCQSCGGKWAAPANVPSNTPTYGGRLDTFARGSSNQLIHKWFDGYKWSGWENLGGSLASGPSVSSWTPGRLDVFAKNSSGSLIHKWYFNGWSSWETLGGGAIASDPDAVSWGNGRIDVVANSSGGTGGGYLMHRWYNGTSWSGWETFTDGKILSGPSITSWGPGRLDVVARGTDNHVYHKFYSSQGGWSRWEALAGSTYDSPDVVATSPNVLQVFVKGTNNQLFNKVYFGGWSDWSSLGGVLTSSPGAASRGTGREDVFVRGSNNEMWHRWNDNAGWSVWENLGGSLTSAPDSVSWD